MYKLQTNFMITDLTYLKGMSGGSSDIIKEMIGIFIEQTQEYIVDMQKHLDEKDYLSLGKLSHKAKSSVAIMGMNDLAADLKTLELLTKDSKDIETYQGYVDKFITQCKAAISELNEIQGNL
jgi:HPt (histidine-containing phosphotransfer) domain-containing protein